MKKVEFFNVSRLKLVILMSLVVFFMTACSKTNQGSLEELRSFYSELGSNHQIGLDCILEDLKGLNLNPNEKLDLDQLSTVVKKTSIRFTIERLGLDPEIENDLNSIQKAMDLSIMKSDDPQTIIDMMNGQRPLTTNEVHYLTKLDVILTNVSSGVGQCVNSIRNLEYEIFSSCSDEEINFLFTATAIGANSVEYWYNNYDIWAEELQMPELIDKKGINHKDWFWSSLTRMGRMDILGGITGAALGAIAGGVGAIPGALSGACIASGNCGLMCLYEHLIE